LENGESANNSMHKLRPIFFPKEYNDEQIEIIEKAKETIKFLVQVSTRNRKIFTLLLNLFVIYLQNGKKVLLQLTKNELGEV